MPTPPPDPAVPSPAPVPPSATASGPAPASPDALAAAEATETPRRRIFRPLVETHGWRAALREFAVIVAGVLCALAAQAWWEQRENREREATYLRQLLADTRLNAERVREAVAIDSAAGVAARRAADALTSTGAPPPADSLVEWISGAGVGSEPQTVSGSYRAVVGTGELRLIRSDTLRAALAAYASFLENETERQRQFRMVVSSEAGEMAMAMPFMRRMLLDGPDPSRVDVRALRDDPRVAGLLFTVQIANANRLSGLRALRKETDGLLALLRADSLRRAR